MRTQVQRHAQPREGRVRRSGLHLLLLWSSIWPGFSYSININKSALIAMANSKHSFVPLMIKCELCLSEKLQLHQEERHLSLSLNQQPGVSSLAVECPRVSAHGVRGVWIRCASVPERLMKSSLNIKVPCGQHSGRAGSKSNLWVPALETQPQPKKKGTRDSQTENTINSTADCDEVKVIAENHSGRRRLWTGQMRISHEE